LAPVALSIGLGGLRGSLHSPPVELDDQPLVFPETVDREETTTRYEIRPTPPRIPLEQIRDR